MAADSTRMKTFEIITETDARVLPRGDTVMLARGGNITPLAQDTLSERRITVVREGRAPQDEASIAPKSDIRRLPSPAITRGSRGHTLTAFLRGRGLAVEDLGTDGPAPVAIPVWPRRSLGSSPVATWTPALSSTAQASGSAIAANKVRGTGRSWTTMKPRPILARAQRGERAHARSDAGHGGQAKTIVTPADHSDARSPVLRRLTKIRDLENG